MQVRPNPKRQVQIQITQQDFMQADPYASAGDADKQALEPSLTSPLHFSTEALVLTSGRLIRNDPDFQRLMQGIQTGE